MAEYLVLKAEDICDDNDCVKSRLIFYYKHYALLNEDFFRETEHRAVAPLDVCKDLDVFPGIYELIFAEDGEEQPALVSVKFVKPVDMWETQDIENEPAANHCSCSHE